MFGFKCPRCKAPIKTWPRSFKEWWFGRRRCTECGVPLRTRNGLFVGALCGLFTGGFLVFSREWGVSNEWIRLGLGAAVCWIVASLFSRLFVRVEEAPEKPTSTPEVRKWSVIGNILLGVSFLAILGSNLYAYRALRPLLRSSSDGNTEAIAQAVSVQRNGTTFGIIAFLIAAVAFAASRLAERIHSEPKHPPAE
jgi:hypothetical protein